MVRKLFGFLYKETNTLNQAALLLGLFALLSQILAFLRDRLLAHYFGASAELDVYYAAFRIPDFLYVSLASLVASAVLIPFIVERLPDRARAKIFFRRMFTLFFWAMLAASIVGFFLMPVLAKIVAPGFSAADSD